MSDITANVVVSQPAQLFTLARSFKANANGKIYIGKIDTDPTQSENQIQVYLENEDGSHIPVAQPLIINAGGYPVYNGQIAKFVTVEGHSMALYNAYGVQEFYYPNVLGYDPDQFEQEWLNKIAAPDSYALFGTFESISQLKTFSAYATIKENGRIYVDSYYLGLGYGGGYFRWNSTSTDADDAGYTINPTGNTGAGRWKREGSALYTNRTVSIVEFGAKINDLTFDSVPAVNAAISYLNPMIDETYYYHQGGDVIIPNGQYGQNSTIYGAAQVRLIGTGGGTGFGYSRAGCTIFIVMDSMDRTKCLFDTAPLLLDGSGRYTRTDQMINAQTISNEYYGTYIEDLIFLGKDDTQCGVRDWHVSRAQFINVAVYGCKVAFWIDSCIDITLRDCFCHGYSYAGILLNQMTTLRMYGGYYTASPTATFATNTVQWFHQASSGSNKPYIAYVSTFMYAYASHEVDMFGVITEGNNRDFALFFSHNYNMFGGYTESLHINSSGDIGRRVFSHLVASTLTCTGTYFNHVSKDVICQSGNILDSATGGYIPGEVSRLEIIKPEVVEGFVAINQDLGYGNYNVIIDSEIPITKDLVTTLNAQRLYTARIINLSNQYTMQQPVLTQGSKTFTVAINNTIANGDYNIQMLMKNVAGTSSLNMKFDVLVGSTCTVTNFVSRSVNGTTALPAPTATFSGGVLTLTFTGNSTFYNQYRVRCVPSESRQIFTF